MVDHILNWAFHCSTDTAELPSTRQRFLTVHAAVTPTRDFPAPMRNQRAMTPKARLQWTWTERMTHQHTNLGKLLVIILTEDVVGHLLLQSLCFLLYKKETCPGHAKHEN